MLRFCPAILRLRRSRIVKPPKPARMQVASRIIVSDGPHPDSGAIWIRPDVLKRWLHVVVDQLAT
ncbi:hypothetical protein RMSM_04731 [Rhodopirellula maiorica SM1]|uniref:Uncharacterized protein n=1 Tax=Rhodopirellula maiorica SM1 TaxID=1265738 RepID=M5RG30_9BACT|nr:hypothetical protein RMSM_04731 [Rhodopirellula maiorica SM1]